MPKVDLHRHLIGSIRLDTLIDIAIENDIPLPSYDKSELKSLIVAEKGSLREFLKPLKVFGLCYCNRRAITRITYEAIEDAFNDGVRYLEMAVSPAFEASFHRLSLEEVLDGIVHGIRLAENHYDVKVNLCVGPSFRWKERGLPSPEDVLSVALKYKAMVRGFGLSAETKDGVPFSMWKSDKKQEYVQVVREAKDAGLKITCHAGEVSGPISIRDAIKFLGADRIGHGLTAIRDKKTIELLIQRNIPLEICLTSNVKSGAVSQMKKHPFRELFDQGVTVTINTDDPTLCQTTLTNEYMIAIKELGLSTHDIRKIILNGVYSAFLNEKERREILKRFCKTLIQEMGSIEY